MSILDRYIIRQFLGTLIFSIGALSIIFLIVNVLESLDKFIDQKVDISIIFLITFTFTRNHQIIIANCNVNGCTVFYR